MAPLTGLVVSTVLSVLLSAEGEPRVPRVHTPAAEFELEEGERCQGLSPQECCEQQLQFAGFRASGDHVPRLVQNLVRLACADEHRVMAPQACRSIAVLRGFRGADLDAICRPAQKACGDGKLCSECTSELRKLGYKGAHHVCRPITYVKATKGRWRR